MDNCISGEKREELRQKFNKSKKAIEALLKQFHYQQGASHFDSMKKLCTCLENVMNVDSLFDFSKYLSNEDHLPIEVNFKTLKFDKLGEIFQDWLQSKQELSMSHLERLPTLKHRNILFKRIFLQQKQVINDYFSTISSQKKLKGFDLFQLLTEILGPYYLYQFHSDVETYFQKINIFQSFLKIVQAFVKSGKRVYKKNYNQSGDENYIRVNQFQSLIQFWETINPELTIQEQPRKNLANEYTQTIPINLMNASSQTQKQYSRNILNFINNSLRQINFLIENENDHEVLSSLDKIFEVLKSQKMFAVSNAQKADKKNNQVFQRNNKFLISSQYSQTEHIIIKPMSPKNRSPSPQKLLLNNHLLSPEKEEDQIKIIFKYLCSLDNLHCLTVKELQNFFYALGLINDHNQFYLVNNLISYGYIQDKEDVNLKEFKSIIRQIMKQTKKINMGTLKSYISNYIQQNSLRKTAFFKNSNQTSFTSRPNMILNQSLVNRDRDRSYRQESRTTFPMDSDGSNL